MAKSTNILNPLSPSYLDVYYGPKTSKGLFAENGLGEYQSFAARKEFLQNASPEILARLGFDADTYKGTAEQNKVLLAELRNQEDLAESMASNIRMEKLETPKVLIDVKNHVRTPESFEKTFGTRYERIIEPNGGKLMIVGKPLPRSKKGSEINYLKHFK